MAIYLKQFSTHSEYEQYINGSDAILPNVSICTTEGDVHYNPWVEIETRVVATFNVTDTSSPTQLCFSNAVSRFSAIEIDDVVQPSVVSAYTFSTTGEHTVKYTLIDPTSIGNSTFYRCTSLRSIAIPSGVTSIGGSAFDGCSSLTSCTIGDGVTSIGGYAFSNCRSLTSIDIPNSVTSIGSNSFYNCSGLTSIDIPDGVTSIGDSAFNYCRSLTSIDIPNSVTSIGTMAFASCYSLTNCTIGSGVTSIGNSAFAGCSGLTSIVSNAMTAPTIQSYTFYDVKTGGTLTVPIGSSGYDVWMGTGNYYLGLYNWTKVEQ